MRNPNGEKLLDIKSLISRIGVGEEMKVADLGCGASGHFVFLLAKAVGDKGTVYAVDVLKPSIENIKRQAHSDNVTNVKTVWGDLEIYQGTKISSSSLDMAIVVNVLHQSKKKESIIRESARLIKKHGKLVIVEWEKSKLPFGPKKEDRVEAEHLKIMAKKHSLNLDEEFFAGNHHYGLIFEKL